MRTRLLSVTLLVATLLCLLVVGLYSLPPIHDRVAWRVQNVRTQIRHALDPPEQVVFVPQEQVDAIVQATLQALAPSVTPSPVPSLAPTLAGPTETPVPSPTPTLPPTPIPDRVTLTGITHEYQQMNNCGPANLAMALSYWGWQGDQRATRAFLRPNFKDFDDKNVMPAEMVAFVETQTGFKALARFGGDLDLLKRLVAAGFPVMIEKGFQPPKEDWMGHFELVSGYDDGRRRLIAQDSYIMPDFPVPYEDVTSGWWRDFNYAYLVVYPPEREAEVFSILGPQVDPLANYRYAAEKARQEIPNLSGRDLYFAWYNLGSSLVGLEDYAGAAQAYDQAFIIYPQIPKPDRPWRMLWYQVGPYEAYYHTGRYQDLIALGNQTLNSVGGPVLEETFYWLGKAREASGELEKAIADYQKAAAIHPGSTPALAELQRLGSGYP